MTIEEKSFTFEVIENVIKEKVVLICVDIGDWLILSIEGGVSHQGKKDVSFSLHSHVII